MKQKIYILGVVTVLIIVIGTLFKVNHWPGASYLIILGIVTLVMIFLPLALVSHYKSEGNRQNLPLYIATWITGFVIFTGMLFKIMHWPYAGKLLLVSIPFPYIVFLPVYFWVTSKIKNFNIFNTVYLLIMLTVLSAFSALLAISVSLERISDSLALSANYNKYERILKDLPPFTDKFNGDPNCQKLLKKADELLLVLDEAQQILLDKAGITEDQWIKDPGIVPNPDSRNFGDSFLSLPLLIRIDNGLKSFIDELSQTPGYENLASAAKSLIGYKASGPDDSPWTVGVFAGNYLSWILVDLDAIELNIISLKLEVASI